MSSQYVVWIEIEHINEEEDLYETEDLPFGSVTAFDTWGEALDFAQNLHEIGLTL